jgi:hypothetical protein
VISGQFIITLESIIRRHVGWQAETLVSPGTQVDFFAALAAKRTKRIAGRIEAGATAAGAHHLPGKQRFWVHEIKK